MKDYYSILEITQNASEEVIRAAYRALVKKYHPDNTSGSTDDEMREINEAFQVLSDPEKRAEYDASRSEAYSGQAENPQTQHNARRYDRKMEKVSPENPRRARVQGLEYCGEPLYEKNEVCIYLNLTEKQNRILKNLNAEMNKMVFKGDTDDAKMLLEPFGSSSGEICQEFRNACTQLGLSDREIEPIYTDFVENSEEWESLQDTVKEYAELFAQICQRHDENMQAHNNRFADDLEGNWSHGGRRGVLGSLWSYGKRSLAGAVTRHETEEALKELSAEYKKELSRKVMELSMLCDRLFVACVNANYEHKWMTVSYKKGQDLTIPDNLPDDPKERLKILIDLLEQQPYWNDLYEVLLDEFGDADGNLQSFASAYGINIAPVKEKMMSRFFSQSNVEEEGFLTKYREKAQSLFWNDTSMYKENCKSYVTGRLSTLSDFSAEAIKAFQKEMEHFDQTHEYDSSKDRNEYLTNQLITRNYLQSKSKDKVILERTLTRLKELEAEYGLDFYESISVAEKKLKRLYERERAREAQKAEAQKEAKAQEEAEALKEAENQKKEAEAQNEAELQGKAEAPKEVKEAEESEQKVVCPNCGKELHKGVKFCNFCGHTMQEMKTCPKCGKDILITAKFCNYCGERVKE